MKSSPTFFLPLRLLAIKASISQWKNYILKNVKTIKRLRKQYGLTQEQLALKSGVGLNFVRELEQGKPTVRLDKVNQVLNLFNYEMTPTEKRNEL